MTHLADRYSLLALGESLLSHQEWAPFPTVDDRVTWNSVRADRRHRIIATAESYLDTRWPVLRARDYAEYQRTGNRTEYERAHRNRRDALAACVVAECLTGTGRFLDTIVDLAWMICEETSWCYPATSHPPRLLSARWDGTFPDHRFPVVDLFSAETGSLLGWTRYLLASALPSAVPVRIDEEIRRRLLVPYRTVDEWRWLRTGANGKPPSNWNPWIHSNLLAATLAVEDDPYLRAALVARIVRGLDAFLDGYGEDGGCVEGASYFWQAGARLFECLELLASATGEKIEPFDKLVHIGQFIHRMHIGGDFYFVAGDGTARHQLGGELLYRFGAQLDDPQIQAHGLSMRTGALELGGPLHRLLPALLSTDYEDAPDAKPPLVRDSWLPDVEALTCREREGSTDGLFLAGVGGHNGENHSHNDIGSFVVALDGHPMIIDVGVGTYTKQTFGGDRYDIWTMRSAYHNVPMINGFEQCNGWDYRARDVTCEIGATTELRLDLVAAYPPEAGVRHWFRSLRLDRDAARITVSDNYDLDRTPDQLTFHLMTWPAPTVHSGHIILEGSGRSLKIEFGDEFRVEVEKIPITDDRLRESWSDSVHRIALHCIRPEQAGSMSLTMAPLHSAG